MSCCSVIALQNGLAPFFAYLRVLKKGGKVVSTVDPEGVLSYLGHLRKQVGLSYVSTYKVRFIPLLQCKETRVCYSHTPPPSQPLPSPPHSPHPHHIYLHPSIITVFRSSPLLGTIPSKCHWWRWLCGGTPQTSAFCDSNIIEILEQRSWDIASKEGKRFVTRPCHSITEVSRPQGQCRPP